MRLSNEIPKLKVYNIESMPIADGHDIRTLQKMGLMKFGSTVFGGNHEGSDVDFIAPPKTPDGNDMFDYIISIKGQFYTDYNREYEFRSAYIRINENTVWNILCMNSNKHYVNWVSAASLMKDIIKQNPIVAEKMQDKDKRVNLFIAIRELLL